MNVISSYAYSGRNIFSHSPVVKMVLDLGEYYNTPSCEYDGFTDKLITVLPNLKSHKCSRGYEGGFIERLREGTYMAHIVEHLALEIQNMLGYDVSFGKTRQADNETTYHVVYSYVNEIAGLESGKIAVDLVKSILRNEAFDFVQCFDALRKKCVESDFGASTAAIKAEAEKRNIPVIRLASGSLLQLGYGKNQKRIQATLTENASCIAVDISCNKALANSIMREYGIPVPDGKVALTAEEAVEISEEIGYPVVIKPNFGNQGKGVSVNLKTSEEVIEAFKIAEEYKNTVLVEKFIEGEHYRLLVVGDKVIAASQRLCPFVKGDGKSTVAELIETENCNPLRGHGHEKPLTKIKIDKIIEIFLRKQKLSLDFIPAKDQVIKLRENDNLSTGGIAVDVTDKVHPEVCEMAVLAAQVIGLDVAGIDVTTNDIGESLKHTGGAIIEINAAPGIRMHHYPAAGESRNVAKAIVDHLCPENREYTIPIVSVTGTNGKTTTVRMISHIIGNKGYSVGMTTTSGVFIDGRCINKGDNTGPVSARTVLTDRNVEYAVLETARGGIVKRGLGYSCADVGIITNISEDHLGLDGINTLEDLAYVKALVAEAVKENGYSVLNADDPYCVSLSSRVKSQIIYYGRSINNDVISKHIDDGGIAFFISNDKICVSINESILPIIAVTDIPSTYNGLLEYNLYNSLAAAAGAFGVGMSLEDIEQGLATFMGNENDNPGRFNIYDVNGVKVVLDYGHNIDAYKCITETLKRMKKNRLTGVIGVPGDRTDTSTFRIGQLCGKVFDRIYIKEDKDLRGRKPGEIAQILKEGCISTSVNRQEITVEHNEEKALEMAILDSDKDDIVIAFYEDYYPLVRIIKNLQNDPENQQAVEALSAV